MEINNIITGVCQDLTHEGLGIIKVDNFPVFIPNLLIDEKAKIKITKVNNNYALGEVIERKSNNPDRVVPACKYFLNCGGCDLMHMNYKGQLSFKLKMVNETYKRIGKLDYQINNIVESNNPYEYRNKVQIPYRFNGKKAVFGFYKKKSHDLVEFESCKIQTKQTTDIAIFVRNLLNEYKIICYNEKTQRGLFKQLLIRKNEKDEYMIVFITRSGECNSLSDVVSKIIIRYPSVVSVIRNINDSINNTILGPKSILLYGANFLNEELTNFKYQVSYNSFFQINYEQTVKLYDIVDAFCELKGSETVVDCYCGVGTISLMLSRKAKKVIGIEVINEAVKNAKKNIFNNKVKKDITFICGKVEEKLKEINNIDVLVLDPPRKGLENEVVDAILEKKVNKVVYVSCDPATQARDLAKLIKTYKITKSSVIDMFPQTANVEVVICLELIK